MQYKNTLEAIYIQIDEIQQSIAKIGADNSLRNIDLDIALSKLRDVYDLVLSLQKENNVPTTSSTTEPEVKTDTPLESDKPVEVEIKADIPIMEQVNSLKATLEKPKKRKQEQELKDSDKIFKANKPTLNEELSAQVTSSDLASRLKNKAITNLSSAIGLNEKFEFIQSLFNGDKEKYEQTIDTLNMATNFNDAYNYLSSSFPWDMEEPLVQRILELIRRKLIVKKND